ncbi:MAG: transglutaminase-like superfamily protein [Bacteriophage sp.]|nr:MAG: transglutaminase-like superfamily protein [Bacteriophage sp.]
MRIAAPDFKNKIVFDNGLNSDIIKTINSTFERAVSEAKPFAQNFKGASNLETSRNIWNYLKNKIVYKKDPPGKQFIKMPRRFNFEASGDCKSFSTFTGGVLGALGMPVTYRYASYDAKDATPTHIYTITKDEHGNDIIIDGVYDYFNREAPYQFKKDSTMQIAVLSGPPTATKGRPVTLDKLLTMVKPGGFYFYVIKNQLQKNQGSAEGIRYNAQQLAQYEKRLIKHLNNLGTKRGAIYTTLQNEINDVQGKRFHGVIPPVSQHHEIQGLTEEIGKLSFKKLKKGFKNLTKEAGKVAKKVSLKNILKGVKTIGLAPMRKAILLMVNLNMLGMASRMAKLPPAELRAFWEKRGGKFSVLQSAVQRGKGKRPVFRGRHVKAVRGIGFVVEPYGVGEDAAGAAAGPKIDFSQILQVAGPLIKALLSLFQKHNIPEETEGEGTARSDSDTLNELTKLGNDGENNFDQYANAAIRLAQNTGVLPEPPQTAGESNINNIIPGDDMEGDPVAKTDDAINSGSTMPIIIGLGVAGALWAYNKSH